MGMPAVPFRLGPAQVVAIGAASAKSTAFSSETYAIRVVADGKCHIRVGTDSVPGPLAAVATDALVSANSQPEYIRVAPGEKLAVIQDGASTGNVSITELTH